MLLHSSWPADPIDRLLRVLLGPNGTCPRARAWVHEHVQLSQDSSIHTARLSGWASCRPSRRVRRQRKRWRRYCTHGLVSPVRALLLLDCEVLFRRNRMLSPESKDAQRPDRASRRQISDNVPTDTWARESVVNHCRSNPVHRPWPSTTNNPSCWKKYDHWRGVCDCQIVPIEEVLPRQRTVVQRGAP